VSLTMKLELVPVPVSDIDRAAAFYADRLGFTLDHDVQPQPGQRFVQLTPPGSAASIVLGTGLYEPAMSGRLRGLHLVVADVAAARQQLVAAGVAVSEVVDLGGVHYAHFADPDGNTWALQQIGPFPS